MIRIYYLFCLPGRAKYEEINCSRYILHNHSDLCPQSVSSLSSGTQQQVVASGVLWGEGVVRIWVLARLLSCCLCTQTCKNFSIWTYRRGDWGSGRYCQFVCYASIAIGMRKICVRKVVCGSWIYFCKIHFCALILMPYGDWFECFLFKWYKMIKRN